MRFASLMLSLALLPAGCKKSEPQAAKPPVDTSATTAKAPEAPKPEAKPGGPLGEYAQMSGTIEEKLEAGQYSYIRVKMKNGEMWAAVPQTALTKGAGVVVNGQMVMQDFESKTLNRKFEKVVFGTLGGGPGSQAPDKGGAPAAGPDGQPGAAAPPSGALKSPDRLGDAPPPASAGGTAGVAGAPAKLGSEPPPAGDGKPVEAGKAPAGTTNVAALAHPEAAPPADVGDVRVPKATGEGAHTIAEVYKNKTDLQGKGGIVTVRGKVVKFNANIMGKNWVHVRDGSGSDGAKDNDLTVTTGDTTKVGDVVIVKGKIHLDEAYGAGYTYPVIMVEAAVSK